MSSRNILIATKNIDKFNIIQDLFIRWDEKYFGSAHFYSLIDFDIQDQIEESGSLMNRAFQKANYAYNIVSLHSDKIEGINLIIGSDDGMKYHDQPINVDSKEITKKILYENLLSEDDILTLVRAFVFIDNKGSLLAQFETNIPFKYKRNISKNIINTDEKYPLNQVVTRINNDIHIMNIPSLEMLDYYISFCRDDFIKNITFRYGDM